MSNSVSDFIPALWSGVLQRHLDKALVFGSRVNTNYEGNIKSSGDTVKIPKLSGSISVSDYVDGTTTLSYEDLDGDTQDLVINQSKSFGFKVSDIDAVQSEPALIGPATERAAYAMADVVDQYIAGVMDAAAGITTGLGTGAAPLEIDEGDTIDLITLIGQQMDEANAPAGGRWIIVPPWFHRQLVLDRVLLDTSNSTTFDNGVVGRVAGFNVLKSNNCPKDTSEDVILAGNDYSTAFASQIAKIEGLRLEGSFHSAVRGLFLYGSKVIEPESLAKAVVKLK
ncbi:phage major capsid protein [Spirochaeta dissipatitropha]